MKRPRTNWGRRRVERRLTVGMALALTRLGGDPFRVALSLDRLGFHGCVRKAGECPVARYLGHHFPGWQVTATTHSAMAFFGDGEIAALVMMPTAVARFIQAFDDGRYPSMIREGAAA